MNVNPQEVKFGDGGYVLPSADSDRFGDVLPLEDGFNFADSEQERVQERAPQAPGEESTQQERLAYVYDVYRFHPKSPEELSAIVGIDRARNSDAGKYMSIIMQHQDGLKIKTVKPTVTEDTAKKLTRDFIGYRDDSRAVSTFLRDIVDQMADTRDDSDLSSIFRGYAGGELRALAQVVRSESMADFIDGEETDGKYEFAKDAQYLKLLSSYVDNNDIIEFREMVGDTCDEERRRHSYWNERLRELKRVTTVRAMAQRALGEI